MINGAMFSALDYGAVGNGTTDDTNAIKAVIAAAVAANGVAYLPAGNYKCTDAITLDVGKCRFVGDSATLTWTTTNGNAFAFKVQSSLNNSYGTEIIAANVSHRIEGITFDATSVESGKITVLISAPGPNGENGGVKFDRCVFNVGPAGSGVYVGSHSYLISFSDCYFVRQKPTSNTNTIGVSIVGATNSGENISFVGCIFDSLDYGLQILDGFATLTNCTIDYFTTNAIQMIGAGSVHLVNCNMETSSATNWISLDGEYCQLFMQNCRFDLTVPTGTWGTTTLIYANNTTYSANVTMVNIDGLYISTNVPYVYDTGVLVSGNAKTKITKVVYQRGSPNWLTSKQSTLIYDPLFSDATADASLWTITAGVAFSGSSAVITGSAGAQRSMYVLIPAKPGDIVGGLTTYATSSMTGAATTFAIEYQWMANATTLITSGGVASTTSNSSATEYRLNYGVPAPAGTTYLKVFIRLYVDTASTGVATISQFFTTFS